MALAIIARVWTWVFHNPMFEGWRKHTTISQFSTNHVKGTQRFNTAHENLVKTQCVLIANGQPKHPVSSFSNDIETGRSTVLTSPKAICPSIIAWCGDRILFSIHEPFPVHDQTQSPKNSLLAFPSLNEICLVCINISDAWLTWPDSRSLYNFH